ncbi:MAG: Mur ligase family protein, partial [Phycisphaerae bacterium]
MSRTTTKKSVKPVLKSALKSAKPVKATIEAKPETKPELKSAKLPDLSTYPLCLRWLHDRTDYEKIRNVQYSDNAFKLDRMRKLLTLMGDPQDEVKTVHVAGTVGKGSTVAMIASMMRECGYTVGEFVSPHLVDVRERVVVNGKPISKNDFTDLIRKVAKASLKLNEQLTFFEVMTAIGLKHFANEAVDIAVIEVGLGGRLDSTNVITPEVCVITTIDYDHCKLLGNTLPLIAREKAGIFKKGVTALVFDPPADVEKVFRDVATKVGADLRVVNKDIEFSSRFCSDPDLGPHA